MKARSIDMVRSSLLAALLVPLWLLALTLAMRGVLDRLEVPSWGNPQGEARSPMLAKGDQLRQEFVAPHAGLAGVDVTIYASAARAKQRATVRLLDPLGADAAETRTIGIKPGTSWTKVRLDMAPLAGSEGSTFSIVVETDSPAGDGLSVVYSPAVKMEGTRLSLNSRPIDGTLQFLTHYSMSPRQEVGLVLEKLAEGRPGLLGRKAFYVVAALLYAGALGLLVWRFACGQDAEAGGP